MTAPEYPTAELSRRRAAVATVALAVEILSLVWIPQKDSSPGAGLRSELRLNRAGPRELTRSYLQPQERGVQPHTEAGISAVEAAFAEEPLPVRAAKVEN